MYPVLKEGVFLRVFQDDDSDDICYFVENAEGDMFEVSRRLWEALLHADGTHPLDLPDKGRQIIPDLKRHGIIKVPGRLLDDGILSRFLLCRAGDRLQSGSLFWKVLNAVLPAAAVLAFAAGVYLMASSRADTVRLFGLLLFPWLLVCSLVVHSVGHLIAALAYGYAVTDIGILLFGVFPLGICFTHTQKSDASRLEKVQFALSGIEANLLTAGMCMVIASQSGRSSLLLAAVANMNVFLALMNSLPLSGFDGEKALDAVFPEGDADRAARRSP